MYQLSVNGKIFPLDVFVLDLSNDILAQKIIANACNRSKVERGEVVVCSVDLAMIHGSGGPRRVKPILEIDALAEHNKKDAFGRNFNSKSRLQPPYYSVKVTGGLFHTQGGLLIDGRARVIKNNGSIIEGLYACGGAACGVSGPDVSGYLSGNGLLTAIILGYIAGKSIKAIEI